MVLFELCSNTDLFARDKVDDSIVSPADREALASWSVIHEDRLNEVFKQAHSTGEVSNARRLMAQDLIWMCLCGNSAKVVPENRPVDMKQVLEHPFFQDDESLPVLPAVPYHVQWQQPPIDEHSEIGIGPDVIISYQSTQQVDMWRIRRCLNALGISTIDGTQVPPGAPHLELPLVTKPRPGQ